MIITKIKVLMHLQCVYVFVGQGISSGGGGGGYCEGYGLEEEAPEVVGGPWILHKFLSPTVPNFPTCTLCRQTRLPGLINCPVQCQIYIS